MGQDALIAIMSLEMQDDKYLQNDKNKLQMKESKTLQGETTTVFRVPCCSIYISTLLAYFDRTLSITRAIKIQKCYHFSSDLQ